MRRIIHVDMDAYFAAIEIRENPSLKGKCVIVGGNPNGRGVVSTCSYEARVFGVRSGMSSHQAWQLCPQGVFVHSHFALYKEISQCIKAIFMKHTDKVESMSLDEAYLDVTESCPTLSCAVEVAKSIKREIHEATQLTCSAGVSYNKFLAKIGSELNKPDGLSVISPENTGDILFRLPIGKFHGIGKVTAARMEKMGIFNGKDLYERTLLELTKQFGKAGMFYYNVVRGIDERVVITESDPKSVSCESTFHSDIRDIDQLMEELSDLLDRLVNRLSVKGIQGRQIVLKIKYDNFENITRSCPLPEVTSDRSMLFEYAQKLLVENWDEARKIRLLGVGVNKLDTSAGADGQIVIPV